jgi:uncharacterized protein (DUF433 family)
MARPVRSDPEILGGTPVFASTRVPFRTLVDYLKEGQALSEFLGDFPTVTREQAVAALEEAKEAYGAAAMRDPHAQKEEEVNENPTL